MGYRPSSIDRAVRILRRLARVSGNLDDTEGVKATLSKLNWSLGTKEIASNILEGYYKFQKIPFSKPRYRRIEKVPFIPTEQEIEALIGGLTRRVGVFVLFLKETGARSGEAWGLTWTDLDLANRTVSITPEKNSNPRVIKLSPRLIEILASLPKNRGSRVFGEGEGKQLDWFGRLYQKQRTRIASKLGNPRIRGIHFHTLRHWKGSTEYHKTKDIVYVQRLLGHKNIGNTLRYITLDLSENDSFIVKVAKTITEASSLIEDGFLYVTEIEGVKLFKKPK